MSDFLSRTKMLIGEHGVDILQKSKVAVFGVGGVGSFVVEAFARAGIGELHLFDNDIVCASNINRQLIATTKTIGLQKVEVARERILDINPNAKVVTNDCFYSAENADDFDLSQFDYIIDAIDTVTSKLLLIQKSQENNVKIISSMGTGNKLDPTMFEIADIKKTSVCPLARIIRRELKTRGITKLKVCYSKELPITPINTVPAAESCNHPPKRQTPASISFVPSVAGLIIAGEAIRELIS